MQDKYKNGIYTALTIKGEKGLLREIILPVSIKIPESFSGFSHEYISVQAIWDTGATNSVIATSLAEKMELPPIGKSICRGVHGEKEVYTYIVDIILNNRVQFLNVPISAGDLLGDKCQFLIGMDIIAKGDSSIGIFKDENGIMCTIFTFRFPSLMEPIDYVQEINSFNKEKEFYEKNKQARKEYNQNRPKKKRRR